jgi:hypothetical protein
VLHIKQVFGILEPLVSLYLYYQLHSLGQLTQRVMSGVVITLHPSAAGVSSKLFLFLFSLSRFASGMSLQK